MQLVDVHCHLDLYGTELDPEPFVIEEFLAEQEKAGVKAIITNGVHPESNRKVLELAKKYAIVKPALGYYPTHVLEDGEEKVAQEIAFIREQKPIAIGEIGLDNHEVKDQLEPQKKALRQLVALAKELDVPVLIHSRKAELETIELLEEIGYKKVVMHCFTGKKKLIPRIIENGWYFSIPCSVVKLEQMQHLVEMVPIKQVLTETDGPLLSPFSDIRRNESKFIAESIKKIAEIKGFDENETATLIFMNYQKLFL